MNGWKSAAPELIDLDTLYDIWNRKDLRLRWSCPFAHPAWLKAWWDCFGENAKSRIVKFESEGRLLGVAPLMETSEGIGFVGSPDLFDYHDVVVAAGEEEPFFRALVRHLKSVGQKVRLGPVRSDSFVYRHLEKAAAEENIAFAKERIDVARETRLSGGWEGYLAGLSGKQRHEIRRKTRRLEEAGDVRFQIVENEREVETEIEVFLDLFGKSRLDKAAFLTERKTAFFRKLAKETSRAGMLRLFFLRIDERTAAGVLCFDFEGVRYLYNNGYDPEFQKYGVGATSKVLSIKDAADSGMEAYSFLRGDEAYKARLGGNPVELYSFETVL